MFLTYLVHGIAQKPEAIMPRTFVNATHLSPAARTALPSFPTLPVRLWISSIVSYKFQTRIRNLNIYK